MIAAVNFICYSDKHETTFVESLFALLTNFSKWARNLNSVKDQSANQCKFSFELITFHFYYECQWIINKHEIYSWRKITINLWVRGIICRLFDVFISELVRTICNSFVSQKKLQWYNDECSLSHRQYANYPLPLS